jgi:hypothetical protein
VVIDGTLILIDRVAADRPFFPASTRIRNQCQFCDRRDLHADFKRRGTFQLVHGYALSATLAIHADPVDSGGSALCRVLIWAVS